MHTKLISIITIVYNDVRSIERTIASVLSKKTDETEYIVVDGASSDGTADIINKYLPDIDCVISEKDHGISDAFNKGIARANGNWLLFLNSGDILNADADFNSLQKVLIANSDKLLCFYNVMIGDMSHTLPSPQTILLGKDEMVRRAEIPHQGAFINAAFFKTYGTFSQMFRLRMDYELFARIRKQPGKVTYVNEVISVYERGGRSNQPQNFRIFFTEGIIVKIRYGMKMSIKEMLRFFYYVLQQQFSGS